MIVVSGADKLGLVNDDDGPGNDSLADAAGSMSDGSGMSRALRYFVLVAALNDVGVERVAGNETLGFCAHGPAQPVAEIATAISMTATGTRQVVRFERRSSLAVFTSVTLLLIGEESRRWLVVTPDNCVVFVRDYLLSAAYGFWEDWPSAYSILVAPG